MSEIDQSAAVAANYTGADLDTAILNALRAAGKDPDALAPEDLVPEDLVPEDLVPEDLVPEDHFHAGGKAATLELARLAGIQPGMVVLDIGGGIGGPARMLASEIGCDVTVLDLTEGFCRTGAKLTARTGLADRVTFRHGNALDMPFADASFDLALLQHAGMTIEDKPRLYAAARRVLRPGGRFALHEVMAGQGGPLTYPVP
jgi:SAM-dependent methyltransferase